MYLRTLTICSMLGLCACGGSSSTSVPYQYPLDSAFTAYEQMNENFTLTATSGANTYTLQISSVPGSLSTFDSVSAYTSAETVTLSENGTIISNDSQTLYYTIGPYTRVGAIDANGQETVYADQTALPDLASAGQLGAFDTYTTYTDSTRNTVYATGTTTWSTEDYPLQPNDPITFACLNSVGTVNGSASSESDCYLLDLYGDVLTLQVTMTVNGVTLVFK